ncbi:MAG: MetQ/NlpA family ABC transporter substrate-binding protein, partial [Clostridia bacterium]
YVVPNTSLADGGLDANYFQHQPYLTEFNEKNGTDIVSIASVHYEPFAIYPGKTASLEELADGAVVSVPNDPSNEARALNLLEAAGLITLKEGVGLEATVNDIVDNPKNLKIMEIEAAQLPRALPDVDIAVINGNYAIDAGLSVANDAIFVEDKTSEAAQLYANILAVRAEDADNEALLKVAEVLTSDAARKFIEETYDGGVIPMF